MPLLSTINKLTRDFMSLYKVPGVMCQAVEGHCYQLMMGSHLHWGRGAGGEQGEPEGIHWSQRLLQLWKINNSHYVSVNASWRVSRGGAVPALPGWKAKKGGLMWWGRQTYIWAINCCRKCQKPCDSSPPYPQGPYFKNNRGCPTPQSTELMYARFSLHIQTYSKAWCIKWAQ